jgi:AcrR family transcriptional regulator
VTQEQPDFIPLQNSFSVSTPKRAKRADAVANRQLILETAERLFTEQGVVNVKMMAIAEAAGIGQGTLYRAFTNKGELCLALMDEDLYEFQEEILTMFREVKQLSALAQLERFMDCLIHFLDKHTALMCEVQGYEIFGDEINHTGLHTWFHHTIGLLLQRANAQGEIRPNVDIAYLTDALLAPLNPNLFSYQRQELGLALDEISGQLRQLMLRGIQQQIEGNDA